MTIIVIIFGFSNHLLTKYFIRNHRVAGVEGDPVQLFQARNLDPSFQIYKLTFNKSNSLRYKASSLSLETNEFIFCFSVVYFPEGSVDIYLPLLLVCIFGEVVQCQS